MIRTVEIGFNGYKQKVPLKIIIIVAVKSKWNDHWAHYWDSERIRVLLFPLLVIVFIVSLWNPAGGLRLTADLATRIVYAHFFVLVSLGSNRGPQLNLLNRNKQMERPQRNQWILDLDGHPIGVEWNVMGLFYHLLSLCFVLVRV